MRVTVASVFVLLIATSVLGQHFEISPSLGLSIGGRLDASDTDLFSEDLDVDESASFGLTVGIPVSRDFAVEVLFRRQDSSLTSSDRLFSPDRRVADIQVDYLHGGVRWSWGGGQLKPFVVGGLGLTRLTVDIPGVDAEDEFSGHLGGGLDVEISDSLAFRVEGRGFWTKVGEDRGRRCHDCYGRYRDDGLGQLVAQAGLVLSF